MSGPVKPLTGHDLLRAPKRDPRNPPAPLWTPNREQSRNHVVVASLQGSRLYTETVRATSASRHPPASRRAALPSPVGLTSFVRERERNTRNATVPRDQRFPSSAGVRRGRQRGATPPPDPLPRVFSPRSTLDTTSIA